jgi:hypothetical protein
MRRKSEVAPVAEGIPISVAADGTPILSPRVNITTAQTTVSAADGETIILGGLITRGTQTTERRVPYLSDIPIAGRLFRFDSKAVRRTELLIILTPRVIRGQEDMEQLKRVESARMSWCAADIHELHGDTGMCFRENCPICEAGTLVVYPDLNPRGVPLESLPATDPDSLDELTPSDDIPYPQLMPPGSADRQPSPPWGEAARPGPVVPARPLHGDGAMSPVGLGEASRAEWLESQPLPGHPWEQQWGSYVTRVSNQDPRQASEKSALFDENPPAGMLGREFRPGETMNGTASPWQRDVNRVPESIGGPITGGPVTR